MSGGGIVASIGRVFGYLIAIGLVAAIIAAVAVTFVQPHADEPQVLRSVRTALGRMRGQGAAVGRAVPGMDPPSIAERLATQESTRLVTTASQEVIMVGSSNHPCLGGDKEVMLEVQNDIGADQLDVSYSLENLEPSTTTSDPARILKLASCGAESFIKQCIPIAPEGKGVRLFTLAYYPAGNTTRKYPTLLDNEALKAAGKIELNASSFEPVVVAAE